MAQRSSRLVWTLALFFFSGATSLVYEVLWTRRLSLTFGHTVLAVSTVLTVFMSGLALGSFLAGRWSDKERARLEKENRSGGPPRFLALYGKLEIFIGIWAVLSLLLLNGVESLYLNAAQAGSGASVLYSIVFLGSFAVLLPPTTAMGATLPVFTQLLVATRQDVGSWLSRIYGWNTLGACCGAGVGGFILLPLLGLKFAVGVAALGNLAIGVVAIKKAGELKLSSAAEEESSDQEGGDELEQEQSSGGWFLPVAFGLSGFAAMVYQLGWTRGLVLSIGSSTYSFAIILTAFLASLGLGSLIYKRLMQSRTPRVMHLAYLQFGIALSGLLATVLIGKLPQVMVQAIPALDYQFGKILAFDFFLCVLLMILPTLAMGLTFPLVTHLYTDKLSSLGKRLGEAYAANTLGAIIGSFLGGFVFLPQFGAQNALFGAVILNLTVGLALALVSQGSKVPALVLSAVGALALVVSPTWKATELSAGAGIYAKADNFLFEPAYYKDGLSATVTVGYNGPQAPYLKVNGKTDASVSIQDMAHQVLLGLLPVSLHPNPKTIALVGLGSGVTTATLVATESVQEVQCSELEPAIVEVQEYFAPFTEHVLDNPKLHMSVTDGRTFILGSPKKYDLIISQPSNPWIAGIGNLYTEDFYLACVEQLEEGGLMCQWFQLYSVSEYDLNLVLATFYKVFPEGMVFQTGPGDILLVGAQQPVSLELSRMEELWKEEELSYWSQLIGLLEPRYLLGSYVATRQEVIDALNLTAKVGHLNTDDRPLLEFQAPRSLYLRSNDATGFPSMFPNVVPQNFATDREAQGKALLGRIQLTRMIGLDEKVELALENQIPWSPLAAALLDQRAGDLADAEGLLRALAPERAAQPAAQILIGDLRMRAQQWDLAALHFENALQDPPSGSRYMTLMKLGECAVNLQEYDRALVAFQEAAELTTRPDAHYLLGHVTFLQTGDPQQALIHFEEALKRDKYDHATLYRAAFLYAQLGELEKALSYSERSYQAFRENHHNVELLSKLMGQAGREAEARKYQEEALRLKQMEAAKRDALMRKTGTTEQP